MKKILSKASKLVVALALVLSLSVAFTHADETTAVTGTQTIYVNGYDWGPGTDKTVIKLSQKVDAVDAADFTANEHRTAVDWTGEYPFTPTETDVARKVTAVYLSDANGNKVTDSSEYVTVELYVSPSEGDPFNYILATGFNEWASVYQVQITGKATVNGAKVDLTISDGTYDQMVTSIDYLKEDKMVINNTTYDYSYYQPTTSGKKGLMIWLHGAGEGTHDPSLVTLGNRASVWAEEAFTSIDGDAYVLYPQCPTMWMDVGNSTYCSLEAKDAEKTIYTEDLMTLIKNFVAAHPDIDTDHIVIGGCSNGGYMTINMIIHYPDYFAAAYPTCEAYYDNVITDAQIEAIKDMPIWFTFADTDETVPYADTTIPTYKRLIAAGAKNVFLTEYEKVVDTSGLYKDKDGNAYEYNGHWSWIYLDNNDAEYAKQYEGGIHAWLASYLVVPAASNSTASTGTSVPNTGIYGSSASLLGVAVLAALVAYKKRK